MGGGNQPLKGDKPSIKYRCNPLDGAFIELANFDCEGYAPTSDSSKQNGEISEPKSPDILSTRELVSAIGHVWDSAARPLSALLSKRSSRYDHGRIQHGKVLPSLTDERTCSSADDEHISNNGDSSSTRPENMEYLRVTEKISLVEHSRRHYSVFWGLQQGSSGVPQESWDGKGLRSIGIPCNMRNIYRWMNDAALVTPKRCVISAGMENDHLADCCVGNESSNPSDCCNSVDLTNSVNNVSIRASNTLEVDDDVRSPRNIDANSSILSVRLQKESDLNLSANNGYASEEEKCRTDKVPCENNDYLPMKATEHNGEAKRCVSSKEKAHYMTAKREHAFAGAMAGICVSLCLHPLDTIKTVVQSCHANQNSLHHIGKSIVLERGVTGLYRGISSNIASSAPISAIYTFTYESVKGALLPLFPKEYQSLAHCMAGGCASIATSFIYTPSERIKQQMQVGSHYQNCWSALIKIIEKGGLPSLYAGWGAVLCRNVPHSIIKFYTYESLKQLMFPAVQSRVQTNTLVTLTCGGLAGSTAALFTTPFDVVKTRLQTQVPGSINQYNGVLNTLIDIGKREGLKGLYRGLTPRLFMYMTQGALFFASYESFKRLFCLEDTPLNAQKSPGKQRIQEDLTSLASPEHDSISCLAN